jgi:hypothetical protein
MIYSEWPDRSIKQIVRRRRSHGEIIDFDFPDELVNTRSEHSTYLKILNEVSPRAPGKAFAGDQNIREE